MATIGISLAYLITPSTSKTGREIKENNLIIHYIRELPGLPLPLPPYLHHYSNTEGKKDCVVGSCNLMAEQVKLLVVLSMSLC